MPWFHAVAESEHDIQNPISAQKILLLGERLGLEQGQRVLDIACGRCGPALLLASKFGCEIVGVEKAAVFAEAGRERVAAAGLGDLITIHELDARDFPIEKDAWDAALCLGATWIWNGLEGTVAALVQAARPGGYVAVGHPYARGPDADDEYVSLAETVRAFERTGPPVTVLVDASEQDWDEYESRHWASLEQWLAEHPDDPEAADIRAQHEHWKWRYLDRGRSAEGWAIFAGRKR